MTVISIVSLAAQAHGKTWKYEILPEFQNCNGNRNGTIFLFQCQYSRCLCWRIVNMQLEYSAVVIWWLGNKQRSNDCSKMAKMMTPKWLDDLWQQPTAGKGYCKHYRAKTMPVWCTLRNIISSLRKETSHQINVNLTIFWSNTLHMQFAIFAVCCSASIHYCAHIPGWVTILVPLGNS